MTFRDDESRIRKDHAPANFTTLKHIAYNLIRTAPERTAYVSNAKSPLGTTTFSQASSPHEIFTRFPWICARKTARNPSRSRLVVSVRAWTGGLRSS
jgi:hypothetical protein